MEKNRGGMKNVGDFEEAGNGVLLEVANIMLDIGKAPEVVLQGIQLERGETLLGEFIGLWKNGRVSEK